MKLVKHIQIPDDIRFEDLHLSRDPVTGLIEFDAEPVERVCEANDIDADTFLTEDNIGALLNGWYQAHLANGGAPDQVQEQVLAEGQAEDEFGLINVQEGPGTLQ
jgi:hypothetical protein